MYAMQLHFNKCPFPNQIQFGLKTFCVEFVGEINSKPNPVWFGNIIFQLNFFSSLISNFLKFSNV